MVLNDITVKNKFPIPLVEDLFSKLVKAKYFTKLDLRAGSSCENERRGGI